MTLTYSRKLLPFMIPLSLFGSAAVAQQATDPQASSSQDTAKQRERVANATISNMLPVDGCSYPVSIGGREFAPDAASQDAIDELVPAGGTMDARISYHLTGATGHVECGFGTSMELPEISFQLLEVLE